ncbi:MAG: STAS domain-containing protein [Oleibacter sp.]|nr:STAS domain-containing protein [Thalassolituus sp.]
MFKYQTFKRKCRITISNEMTIYTAGELKEKLSQVLDDPRDLEINLSKVNEIDSAGIQLLMLAKKSRSLKQYKLSLVEHTHDVIDAFEALGLVSYFGDPLLISNN